MSNIWVCIEGNYQNTFCGVCYFQSSSEKWMEVTTQRVFVCETLRAFVCDVGDYMSILCDKNFLVKD